MVWIATTKCGWISCKNLGVKPISAGCATILLMKKTNSLTDDKIRMVEENMKLVSFVIKKYVRSTPNPVLFQWHDLFQTGCVGLIKAAKAFDPNAGCTFSTFATRCILNQIRLSFRTKSVPTVSYDMPISNESGEWFSLEQFLQDISQDVSSQHDMKTLMDFLREKSQKSQKDSVVIETMLKLRTQQQAARALQCSQAQVSRYVNRLRSEIKTAFL